MSITIKLPTPLRRHADGSKTVTVEASAISEALTKLVELHPAIEDRLYDSGALKSVVRIFVGDRDIDALQGPDTPLSDGDTISIIPPIAGA